MWQLKHIHADNIAAFEALDYDIQQGVTTLVFGENMDNDAQKSNGSGKSALLECLAIAILGEPLRKIRAADEIINDRFDYAKVVAQFHNTYDDTDFVIHRKMERKHAQEITCMILKDGNEIRKDETVQATVSDYNKYILGKLGLSREDIFSNYILSKFHYSSFIWASDRDKKDIINRFSSADKVDTAIVRLDTDIAESEAQVHKDEVDVSRCDGSIMAIDEQIESEEERSAQENEERPKRIAECAQKRDDYKLQIRNKEEDIAANGNLIKKYDDCLTEISGIGDKDITFSKAYAKIAFILAGALDFGTAANEFDNWPEKVNSIYDAIDKTMEEQKSLEKALSAEKSVEEKCDKAFKSAKENAEAKEKEYSRSTEEIRESIKATEKGMTECESRLNGSEQHIKSLRSSRAELEASITGEITCPHCGQVFILGKNVDIGKTKSHIDDLTRQIEDEEKNRKKIEKDIKDGNALIADLRGKLSKAYMPYEQAEEEAKLAKRNLQLSVSKVEDIQSKLEFADKSLERSYALIDERFRDMIEQGKSIMKNSSEAAGRANKMLISEIENINAIIAGIEGTLKELNNTSGGTQLDLLLSKKKEYTDQRDAVKKIMDTDSAALDVLKDQRSTFLSFQTYLANTKIEALSQETNVFLKHIGSDLRIKFSGYTVLKSGKVRDKISISISRNGVDCGSIGKFSAGEQARCELAVILAMHKLCNAGCEDGKGLDILVIDELLDSMDEDGLINIFEALNSLRITAMVVTHVSVAEGYGHKLIIQKNNGVSRIKC